MSFKSLTPEDQMEIVHAYENGVTQTYLADLYGVSRRTIYRVLVSAGIIDSPEAKTHRKDPSISVDEQEILNFIREKGINLKTLKRVAANPAFTDKNIVEYFSKIPLARYGRLLRLIKEKRILLAATRLEKIAA